MRSEWWWLAIMSMIHHDERNKDVELYSLYTGPRYCHAAFCAVLYIYHAVCFYILWQNVVYKVYSKMQCMKSIVEYSVLSLLQNVEYMRSIAEYTVQQGGSIFQNLKLQCVVVAKCQKTKLTIFYFFEFFFLGKILNHFPPPYIVKK